MSIKSHIKNLGSHSLIYTISTFIQRSLALILLPLYTSEKYFEGTGEYGSLSLIFAFIAFMNILFLYGMDSAFIRHYYSGKHTKEDVYKTAFWGVGVNALFWSILIFLLAHPLAIYLIGSAAYTLHLKLVALILFMDAFSNLPYQILRAEEKSTRYSLIKIFRFLIEIGLNIYFVVVLQYGILGIFYATTIASFANLLVLVPDQLRYLKGSWNRAAFKSLLRFGLPLLPNGLAYLVIEMIDKFLMRHVFLDEFALGIYSANYKFGTILLVLITAFRTAWQPFFIKIAHKPEAKTVYARVFTYYTLLGVMVITMATFFLEYILTFTIPFTSMTLLGKGFWSGIKVIPVVITGYLFFGMYVNFTVGIYILKKTQYMLVFTGIAAIVNIAANFALVPMFGIMGAAWATLISYLVMALSIWAVNQKIFTVPYDYKRVGFLLIYLSAILAIYYFYQPLLWERIGIILLSLFLFFVGGFFSKAERKVIQNSIKRIRS